MHHLRSAEAVVPSLSSEYGGDIFAMEMNLSPLSNLTVSGTTEVHAPNTGANGSRKISDFHQMDYTDFFSGAFSDMSFDIHEYHEAHLQIRTPDNSVSTRNRANVAEQSMANGRTNGSNTLPMVTETNTPQHSNNSEQVDSMLGGHVHHVSYQKFYSRATTNTDAYPKDGFYTGKLGT